MNSVGNKTNSWYSWLNVAGKVLLNMNRHLIVWNMNAGEVPFVFYLFQSQNEVALESTCARMRIHRVWMETAAIHCFFPKHRHFDKKKSVSFDLRWGYPIVFFCFPFFANQSTCMFNTHVKHPFDTWLSESVIFFSKYIGTFNAFIESIVCLTLLDVSYVNEFPNFQSGGLFLGTPI